MRPNFPKTHSCNVHHPLETFFGLVMDCGKQLGQAEIVFNPTEELLSRDRPEITCRDCRALKGTHDPGKTYEYGFVDREELKNWMAWREAS